jgi:hypothetical protein
VPTGGTREGETLLGELVGVSYAWGRGGDLERVWKWIGGQWWSGEEGERAAQIFARFCNRLPFNNPSTRDKRGTVASRAVFCRV